MALQQREKRDLNDCKARISFLEDVLQRVIGSKISSVSAEQAANIIKSSMGGSKDPDWFYPWCKYSKQFIVCKNSTCAWSKVVCCSLEGGSGVGGR